MWDTLLESKGLLRQLARTYATFAKEQDAGDLLHGFVLDRLPGIANRLDLIPADRREAYLAVAFRNYAVDHQRSAARRRRALASFSEGLAVAHDDSAIDAVERPPPVSSPDTLVREGLALIQQRLRNAVGAYLGIGGAPRSIRAIAVELGISRHEAQRLVVDGALALAIVLGRSGLLEPRQVDVCRLLLLQGLSFDDVGETLGLTPHQAREALDRARSEIGRHLKNRRT